MKIILKKVLLFSLTALLFSACATTVKYTFSNVQGYESDRKAALLEIAKTSKDTYDYTTKIYKGGYVKDYDFIVITTTGDRYARELFFKDFVYYCDAIDGYMEETTKEEATKEETTPYAGLYKYINKYEEDDTSYQICYNKQTREPIFSIRDAKGCDSVVANQKFSIMDYVYNISGKCFMSIKTEDYYKKLINEKR